jgi:hypothetical protein|tara:strand:+ start:1350 stop:1544 length:195 start_codon:yes stop_codon:yes gene_type:complete
MRIEMLLQRLVEEQAMLARETLEQPSGREAYDFGRAVGLYAGIERAKIVLIDLVKEHEKRGFDL